MFKKIASTAIGLSIPVVLSSSTLFVSTLAFPSPANAWFDVCNKSGEEVTVAFAYLDINGSTPDIFGNREPMRPNGWNSEGWWTLNSGKCARVYPHQLNERNSYFYVHAHSSDGGTWGGNHNFCTISNEFTLGYADKVCGLNGTWKSFSEVDTGNAKNYTYSLTD